MEVAPQCVSFVRLVLQVVRALVYILLSRITQNRDAISEIPVARVLWNLYALDYVSELHKDVHWYLLVQRYDS